RRVSGFLARVPLELIWWSREYAESNIDALFRGDASSTADALAHGVPLRTSGSLARWQLRLRDYPPELAAARIEEAALTWGGFAAAGLLTLARPGERLALVERMLDDASRVLRIVYALNRVWQPTHKRLATRVAPLAVKPEGLAARAQGQDDHRDDAAGRECDRHVVADHPAARRPRNPVERERERVQAARARPGSAAVGRRDEPGVEAPARDRVADEREAPGVRGVDGEPGQLVVDGPRPGRDRRRPAPRQAAGVRGRE